MTYKKLKTRGARERREDGFPKSGGGQVRGAMGGRGAIGVIANITWHPKARSEIPREGIGASHPRSAVRLENYPIPQFQWRPWFRPR